MFRPGLTTQDPQIGDWACRSLLCWCLLALWSALPGVPDQVSLFSTEPLLATLRQCIGFERLNGGDVRLAVTAVNAETGEDVVFDTAAGALWIGSGAQAGEGQRWPDSGGSFPARNRMTDPPGHTRLCPVDDGVGDHTRLRS